jgi:cysteine desulfurase/selenocysteine lyase
MNDYRAMFPVLDRWVFFNHASTAPLNRMARERIDQWTEDATINGNVNEGRWFVELESRRSLGARMINARTEEIAFLKNTSEGIALVAEGFPWKSGDNVIIAEGEYPANVYPWMNLVDRGVEVRTVPLRGTRIEPADIEARIDSRTRLLSISFVQFSTGFRSDLVRLGELCHKRGIDFCVDAIQGLGILPVDVEAMRIDYLSADGHKWLTSPAGAAIVFIRASKLEKIRTVSVGWKSIINSSDYSTIDFRLRPEAARHEEGSPNVPGILALGASLELFQSVGIRAISDRVKEVTDESIARLEEIGAEIVSPRGESEWSGIVSFILADKDPMQVVKSCKQAGVVLSSRAGRLRISPHFYNNTADIDRVISAINSV